MSTGLRFTLEVDGLPPDALAVESMDYQHAQYEVFDYLGRFKGDHGHNFARWQTEGWRNNAEMAHGESRSPAIWSDHDLFCRRAFGVELREGTTGADEGRTNLSQRDPYPSGRGDRCQWRCADD